MTKKEIDNWFKVIADHAVNTRTYFVEQAYDNIEELNNLISNMNVALAGAGKLTKMLTALLNNSGWSYEKISELKTKLLVVVAEASASERKLIVDIQNRIAALKGETNT